MAANSGAGVPLCDLQVQYRDLQPQLDVRVTQLKARYG